MNESSSIGPHTLALVWLFVSVLSIWGLGTALVARYLPQHGPARWATAMGYGYFVGVFGLAAILLGLEQIFGHWSIELSLAVFALISLFLTVVAGKLRGSGPLPQSASLWDGSPWRGSWVQLNVVWKGAVLALLALLAVRLGGLALEGALRPVFAWDAWYYWSYRARGFLEADSSHAFVTLSQFREGMDGYGQYYRHPPLVSVIQLWPALVLGSWHETLVNVHWWLALPALGLALFGQLRRFGLGLLPALAAVYIMLSVPLLGFQMALGGYADIWVVAAFGLAAFSGAFWLRDRSGVDLILFLSAVTLIFFLKQAGVVFSLPLLVAFVTAWWRPTTGLIVAAVLGALLSAVAIFWGLNVPLPGLGSVVIEPGNLDLPGTGDLFFDPQWTLFFYRLFLEGSWNLLYPLATVLMVTGFLSVWRHPVSRFLWVLVFLIVLIAFFAYSSTEEIQRLIDGTGFGRHMLPLTPVLVFWLFVILHHPQWTARPAKSHAPLTASRAREGALSVRGGDEKEHSRRGGP